MKKSNLLKLLALALSLLALLSFAACGNAPDDKDEVSTLESEGTILGSDDTDSDNATGKTEGTELEEDIFETPDSDSSKDGANTDSSNKDSGGASKFTSSKDNDSKKEDSKDNESEDTSSKDTESEENTSSEVKMEVTGDGTIKLPPVKLN